MPPASVQSTYANAFKIPLNRNPSALGYSRNIVPASLKGWLYCSWTLLLALCSSWDASNKIPFSSVHHSHAVKWPVRQSGYLAQQNISNPGTGRPLHEQCSPTSIEQCWCHWTVSIVILFGFGQRKYLGIYSLSLNYFRFAESPVNSNNTSFAVVAS